MKKLLFKNTFAAVKDLLSIDRQLQKANMLPCKCETRIKYKCINCGNEKRPQWERFQLN